MARTDQLNVRIEPELKREGEAILQAIGINPSDAIRMFYRQIVMFRGLTFDARIPNEETISALNEPLENMKFFATVDEFFDGLEKDD